MHASVCACLFLYVGECAYTSAYVLLSAFMHTTPSYASFFRGTQTVKYDFQLLVGGPTPNKALFKVLVEPPGDFSLMVTVCYQVI